MHSSDLGSVIFSVSYRIGRWYISIWAYGMGYPHSAFGLQYHTTTRCNSSNITPRPPRWYISICPYPPMPPLDPIFPLHPITTRSHYTSGSYRMPRYHISISPYPLAPTPCPSFRPRVLFSSAATARIY